MCLKALTVFTTPLCHTVHADLSKRFSKKKKKDFLQFLLGKNKTLTGDPLNKGASCKHFQQHALIVKFIDTKCSWLAKKLRTGAVCFSHVVWSFNACYFAPNKHDAAPVRESWHEHIRAKSYLHNNVLFVSLRI